MPHPQLETEIERLYETESLTDELMDEEANALLQWGEAQVRWLAEHSANFEIACEELRRLMGRINAFVGLKEGQTPDEQQSSLARIYESAIALGYPLAADFADHFARESAEWDAAQCMSQLLAQLSPTAELRPPQTLQEPSIIGFSLSALSRRSDHDEESVQKDGDQSADGKSEAE